MAELTRDYDGEPVTEAQRAAVFVVFGLAPIVRSHPKVTSTCEQLDLHLSSIANAEVTNLPPTAVPLPDAADR